MRRILIGSLVLVVLGAAGWSVVAGNNAPAEAGPTQSEHERIIRYWTPDRVAKAIPRDIVVGGPPGQAAAKGASSGGGSSSSGTNCLSTTVTGATWGCGGTVAQTTGKVYFLLGSTAYVCSGSVVWDGNEAADTTNTRSLVLTAGHCSFDDVADSFATNWMFIPAYQDGGGFTSCGNTRFGCWTAESLVTTSTFAGGSLNADYAFAVMRPGGKTSQAELDATVGSQQIAFDSKAGDQVYAFGYPAAAKYKGRALVYCAGKDFADPWGSTDNGLSCDMTGGSSGGPWFKAFDSSTGVGTLTSLNSFYYYAMKNVMFGPTFNSYTQKTYDVALTAPASSLITPPG